MLPDALFTIFGQKVYMYGVCIAVGIVLCLLVFFLYTKKGKMSLEVQDFTFFVAIIAIAIGFAAAALYQSVYTWINTGKFNFGGDGITFMGGVIGGAAAFILCYFVGGKLYFKGPLLGAHKKEFNITLRVAPCCITLAHAFGRIGCMCAGCCYGKETDVGFRIYNAGAYRIPVQLYESLFLFALFTVLSVLYFKRCNITMSIYLIAYAVWRFIIEFFRGDVSERGNTFLGLFPSQWQSVAFLALGAGLVIFYIVKKIPLFLPEEEPADGAVPEQVVAEDTGNDEENK